MKENEPIIRRKYPDNTKKILSGIALMFTGLILFGKEADYMMQNQIEFGKNFSSLLLVLTIGAVVVGIGKLNPRY